MEGSPVPAAGIPDARTIPDRAPELPASESTRLDLEDRVRAVDKMLEEATAEYAAQNDRLSGTSARIDDLTHTRSGLVAGLERLAGPVESVPKAMPAELGRMPR